MHAFKKKNVATFSMRYNSIPLYLSFRLLLVFIILSLSTPLYAALGNTISRDDFDFGHQSGYMYSRFDSAYFNPVATIALTTGFLAYYTPDMPGVLNPYWKKRTLLVIPLGIEYTPCRLLSVQFDITDLFVEFPYKNMDNMGGKSPRFKTKILLMTEKTFRPALVLTAGVTWSSAKPYTMWNDKLNYEESNGLAGAGTGVADYLILFTLSKKITQSLTIHSRLGLAPIGSPIGTGRQADEIPYGVSCEYQFPQSWNCKAEISGMYNGLPVTRRAHYSVFRTLFRYNFANSSLMFNFEKGLTDFTDQWVAGIYCSYLIKLKLPFKE